MRKIRSITDFFTGGGRGGSEKVGGREVGRTEVRLRRATADSYAPRRIRVRARPLKVN